MKLSERVCEAAMLLGALNFYSLPKKIQDLLKKKFKLIEWLRYEELQLALASQA